VAEEEEPAQISEPAESDEEKQAGQREQTIEWLVEHWADAVCPICQTRSWSIGNVTELREWASGGGIVLGGGRSFPLVPVTCKTCGYTVLFNAIKMGIHEQAESDPEPDPEGDGS
jgi:hypothetical protein